MGTITYVATGMTDEVTTCEKCGKPELKGTIRMSLRDETGEETGEIYAGTTCAARLSGRKAKDLRSEARKADDARYQAALDVYHAWSVRHCYWNEQMELKHGVRWARPAEIRAFRESEVYQTALQQFLAEYPEVQRPVRK